MKNENNNNFLLLSLDDEKAKDIANIVNNESCKEILNYLTKKEDTQTNIAEQLNIPLPTVHYNLKQLQKAGLVVWENYRLSEKGKEIRYYKLAQKYIIIAPQNEKKENIFEKIKDILPAFLITILGTSLIYTYNKFQTTTTFAMAKSADMLRETTNKGMDAAETVAFEAAPIATTQTTLTQTILQSNYFWFLAGATTIIVLYLIWKLIKRKK